MAGTAIDLISDRTLAAPQQAARKKRLLKGPAEFRRMRRDGPGRSSD
jgi:hypothetical protein